MQTSNPTANSIAREVKTLAQGLKESLTKLEPWEREIEFQRSNLRRQLLLLIFVHPYAKESKDADHSLWMATSYFLISSYKSRIAATDSGVHQASESHSHRGNRGETNAHHHTKIGIVEYRKLVHRFRQFLAEEAKFWTSFIIRIIRVFDLQSSHATLATLGITAGPDSPSDVSPNRNGRRNLFPNEDIMEPPPFTQKEQKLVMLSKALVCLGDIARYREHYNEGGGRPRAGKDFHDDPKVISRVKARRGAAEQLPRPRNYSRAQECYERARLLVPDVGNASHQLAILASYQQDYFGGVFQYYRAICVKQPYETAASNLDSTLSRNLEIYKSTSAKTGLVELEHHSPKARVERFKRAVVALHALWRLDPAEADKQLPGHEETVVAAFSTLSSERMLSTDIIWKTVFMALGALWRHKMLCDSSAERNSQKGLEIESHIFGHIIHLMQTLFQVGIAQLSDAANYPEPAINGASSFKEGQPDLAQNITAVFRRTLPALRISSKWFSAHLDYVSETVVKFGRDSNTNVEALMSDFSSTSDSFLTFLAKIFPLEKLPRMEVALEEDIEASGFTPLKGVMIDVATEMNNDTILTQNQLHPNEEQLMRIADLLLDMEKIKRSREGPSPIKHKLPLPEDNSFKPEVEEEVNVVASGQLEIGLDIDDDATTISTRTEDDPVNLVIKVVLSSDEDEDEEQILYPKQSLNSVPSSSQPAVSSPVDPQPSLNQLPPIISSAPVQKRDLAFKPVTAEDLVNEMMRPRAVPESTALPRNMGPGSPIPHTARLLFGPGSPSTTTSIWSTTPLDTTLPLNNRRVGYPNAHVLPVESMSNYSSTFNSNGLGVPSVASPRNNFAHQRHLSQPSYGAIGSPVPRTADFWANTQEPSQSSTFSQMSQRHTLSPIGSPSLSSINHSLSYAPLNLQHLSYSSLNNTGGLSEFPSHPLSPFPQTMNDSTWSYTGLESLSGKGSSLVPFGHRQARPSSMQRSGGWT